MEAKRCWLARRIRAGILLPVVGLIAVITMPPPSAGASGLRVASGGSAITRIDALERAWHERAVALGQRSAPARPIGQSDAAVRAASLVAAGVQQISRDTLTGRGAERDTQVEPDIAIDPTSSSTVVTVYQQGRYQGGGSAGPGYATSQDGGRTWTQGDLPNLTTATGGRWDRASDPAVVIGPDGSVYAQTLTIDLTPENGVAVQRSDNGGLTFNDPVLVEDNTDGVHFDDKN